MVLVPPSLRPSLPTLAANHEARIRALERAAGGNAGGVQHIVHGSIYNDGGVIDPGSGDWTIDPWTGGNSYTLNFDTPFVGAPTVLLTPNANNPAGEDPYFVVLITRTVSGGFCAGIEVQTFADDGTAEDGGFDFAVIGAT